MAQKLKNQLIKGPKAMAEALKMLQPYSRLLHLLLSCHLCCCYSQIFAACGANGFHDPTIKTMHEFSVYPEEPDSLYSTPCSPSLSVDAQSLQKWIDELATFSDSPAPSVTRILYTDKDLIARRFIKELMELAGLSVREDTVGNIFGRWVGHEPELPAVATGSHIDAIPYSGKYDGVVGVLGAIEAIYALKSSNNEINAWKGKLL